MSSGWTCVECGSRRIRTVIIDDTPVPSIDLDPTGGFATACPGCGHSELVLPAESRERVVDVRYRLS